MINKKDEKYIFSILDKLCKSDKNKLFYFDNILIHRISDFFNIDNFEEINKKLIEIYKDEEILKNIYNFSNNPKSLDFSS